MTDRVTKLRNSHPELTDTQARGLLCKYYLMVTENITDNNAIQVLMDEFTATVSCSNIRTVGQMLEDCKL